MKTLVYSIVLVLTLSSLTHATGLEATIDPSETNIPVGHSKAVRVKLHNSGTSVVTLTGCSCNTRDSHSGVIDCDILMEKNLDKDIQIGPGQDWTGTMLNVHPSYFGKMNEDVDCQIMGESGPVSQGTYQYNILAQIPVHLTVIDPRRNMDGTPVAGLPFVCDREADRGCDPEETSCISKPESHIYIVSHWDPTLRAYDAARICVNNQPGKIYKQIFDIQVSSDSKHVAYKAGLECQKGEDVNEWGSCKDLVVRDAAEDRRFNSSSDLIFSPDSQRLAYIGHKACNEVAPTDACSEGFDFAVQDERIGPKYEVIQHLYFSPDSKHLAYQAGMNCIRRRTGNVSSKLYCEQSLFIMDEQITASVPAWYDLQKKNAFGSKYGLKDVADE